MRTHHQSNELNKAAIVAPLAAVGSDEGVQDSSYDPGAWWEGKSVMELAGDIEALEAWRRNLARLRENQKT
jgi:hypothetical protein